MRVKIRYLDHEIARCFGSSGKVETIHLSGDAKYEDVLSILREKLRNCGRISERLLDAFVAICEGKGLLSMRSETASSDCEVLVGYADTGG